MFAPRFTHLLVAVAILFSQIASGIHMAGHLHAPVLSSSQLDHAWQLSAAEHAALHAEVPQADASQASGSGQFEADLSCAIYHVYVSSLCVAANPVLALVGDTQVPRQPLLASPALLASSARHFSIRAPPVFS